LQARNLVSAVSAKKTVNFTYSYAPLYRQMGETPPASVKENPDYRTMAAWIDALPPKRLQLINQRLGADLRLVYPLHRLVNLK
jgi:hypothetical protein